VLGVVNRFSSWQHHRTKCHKLRCKICKPFHQILCIRIVLNNKLLCSPYNEIIQRKSVAVWVRFAGIWDKIQHLYYSHAKVLLYGIEACPVNLSDMRSLEFTVRCVLIKLFRTYNCAIIDSCMSLFGLSVSELAGQRVHRFLFKFNMLYVRYVRCASYRA